MPVNVPHRAVGMNVIENGEHVTLAIVNPPDAYVHVPIRMLEHSVSPHVLTLKPIAPLLQSRSAVTKQLLGKHMLRHPICQLSCPAPTCAYVSGLDPLPCSVLV